MVLLIMNDDCGWDPPWCPWGVAGCPGCLPFEALPIGSEDGEGEEVKFFLVRDL